MNELIIEKTAKKLNCSGKQVLSVLGLLEQGSTVPFIARYRKEMTQGLDEDAIREIQKEYEYGLKLFERKNDIIRLIDEKGLLSNELKASILACTSLSEAEDYYRPYKEKRKTRAVIAMNNGLEPLAAYIFSCPSKGDLNKLAQDYINDDVINIEEVLQGASDIIAEKISDEAKYRKYTKDMIMKYGFIRTKKKKQVEDENEIYQMYYDYIERLRNLPAHRILAINRGEKEKILSVSIEIDKEKYYQYIYYGVSRNKQTAFRAFLERSVKDGFDRLILPAVEREIRNELTQSAEKASLKIFSTNLEHLLMQPPLKNKYVLGLDPGFRTGCKLAAVDPTGKVLDIDKVFISLPKVRHDQDEKTLLRMIYDYHIEVIAIGNGTASRESERFIASFINKYHLDIQYVIVSEAGASVYSASTLAKKEFPNYQTEERSAVSIARRLQDPLAELVKIDPKSISVGQYQHDMNQKELSEQLDYVVLKAVNQIGVNINTASASLMQYVSGFSQSIAWNIVSYREEHGPFKNRKEILNVSKVGPKTYEQSVGFLRIMNGSDVLDETAIHPDNYQDADKLLNYLNLSRAYIGTEKMIEALKYVNKDKIKEELHFSHYLINDLINAFMAPHRTPRDNYPAPVLKSDILTIDDLSQGMKMQGTVRNVVDFGAFVDIGLHEDGLIHISKMAKHKIRHPLDIVNVGDIIDVYIYEIDKKRKRVALSLVEG